MSINRRNFLKGSLLGAGVALTGFTGCTSTNKSEVEAVVKECVEKMDAAFSDIELLKKVVASHGEKLKKIL